MEGRGLDSLVRSHLIRRVREGLAEGPVWIAAPPGYGKTMLLRRLEYDLPGSRYLPLRSSVIDPQHLRETLATAEGVSVFLLDDLHQLAEGPEALEELARMIARNPRGWVAGGRWIPERLTKGSFPQTWLTEEDLAFSPEEIARILGVSREQAQRLHARTRGWPMAIALLAQSDAGSSPMERWPQAQDRLFAELARSLLSALPEDLRRFLFRTAVPFSFNIDLAATLLEDRPSLRAQIPRLLDEVRRRRLFLEPAGPSGWWRYHELFREFLLRHAPETPSVAFARTVQWFEEQGDLENAVEHALAGELEEKALQLLRRLPDDWIWRHGRQWTFRRWVLSLGEPVRRKAPDLLLRVGKEIHRAGRWEEGRSILRQALQLADEANDRELRLRAALALASAFCVEGQFRESLAWSLEGLSQASAAELRMRLLKTAADACAGLGRFGEARRFYREALSIAERRGDPHHPFFLRHNLAVGVEIAAGRFAEAQRLLQANRPYYEDRPAQRITHLLGWAILFVEIGNWRRLEEVLAEIEALEQAIEAGQASNEFWFWWCRAMGAIGLGNGEAAARALERAGELARGHPEREGGLAQAQAWWARRREDPEAAIRIAEQALPRLREAPLARALVALERDLAAWAAGRPSLHEATRSLIPMRAGASLIRLRALMALCAHRAGDPRWTRHAGAALRGLRRPDAEGILTHRDPELGRDFWMLCLEEGIAEAQVLRALGTLRPLPQLERSLGHPKPAVRIRAAQAMAATGDERAMPLLFRAMGRERHPEVRQVLRASVQALEALPPPPLEIRLMGGFEARRGGQPIPESAWPRPAVARLLQYFALHRREWLTRERILEDLWPERDLEEAEGIFRRLFSWLHQVLEPAMRPKGPFRYFRLEGESVRFDPYDVVRVDAELFEAEVRRRLAARPIPADELEAFAGQLARWAPLLPGSPYEPWLIPHQERLRALYVEGAHVLAEEYLALSRPAEAIVWAERAISEAPWMEESYQILMRAWARMGLRGQALKVYEQAVEALRRELRAEPAPLTRWLAQRLRRGEPI
ncbi:BTAD domain-containing putative transcriptional regulator [Thermoflexus sp.]|uniref:BTAD domain-containing putative transcriptional regulator n=2 Tax=Thermoflexus sp. TaxID=1969742 RepID=UPI0026253290|nr:BTAD domain-containing putative transcriptional regulator [Thermoflexus sp.]